MKGDTFDATKYSHLGKGTLLDFVKEFLLRNKAFRADVKKFDVAKAFHGAADRVAMRRHFYSEYGVEVSTGFKHISEIEITPGPQVWAVGCRYDEATREAESALSPEVMTQLVEPSELPFRSVNAVFLQDYRDRADLGLEELRRMTDFYSDKLCLMVDLRGPLSQLRSTVGEVVRLHKERRDALRMPEKSRRRLKEWRYYLMVYDLRIRRLSYPKVLDALEGILPDSRDERDVKRYFEECRALINGGYREFLSGPSRP